MKSKTSFINRGILLNDIKGLGWIGAGYLLALLLSVPLKILMEYSRVVNANINPDFFVYLRIFQFDTPLQVILLVLVPILTGMWLFRYLQVDTASDMIHSLPVKRQTLYNTHIVSGLIFLFIPLIITAGVSWALVSGLDLPNVGVSNIFSWLLVAMLINLLFFMTSVFTAMFTGISTLQGILSLILLVLPTGLTFLLLENTKMYTYGFAYDYYITSMNTGASISPLLRLSEFARIPIMTSEIIIYLLVSIALYFLGLFIYQRRHLEAAGSAITFDILRPIFKYGVTFCSMLLIGSYFYDSQNHSIIWTYFGYFLGSFLAYFLTEILLNKSLHVFRSKILQGYGIYALLAIILITGLQVNFVGYEKRLPELAQVKSVYLNNSFYPLIEKERPQASDYSRVQPGYPPEMEIPVPVYTDTQNIAGIYALHQKIISNQAAEEKQSSKNDYKIQRTGMCVAYTLKDGSRFYRQYNITNSNYADKLKPIYESTEYKKLNYPILKLDAANINLLDINANEAGKAITITNENLIREAVKVLQSDVTNLNYEQMTRENAPWADIYILTRDKHQINMRWEKTYTNFEDWLLKVGKLDEARVLSSDVKYAVVAKAPSPTNTTTAPRMQKIEDRSDEQFILELEKDPTNLKISDPGQVEICLRNYENTDQQPYRIFFLLKNGNTFTGAFAEEYAPDFIKTHFAGQK